MSATDWIKFQKSHTSLEDTTIKRMVRRFVTLYPDFCNAQGLIGNAAAYTLIIGGLAKLWSHADTYARDDDTLDMTVAEIDELAGIKGFTQLMPEKWLVVVNPECVKLPKYQEHNGPVAKARAQTAKRVANHRARTSSRSTVTSVTHNGNGSVTRSDQIRTDKNRRESKRGSRLPDDFSPDREWSLQQIPDLNFDEELNRFRDYWNGQPGQKGTKLDWPGTWRNWIRRCNDSGRYAKAPPPAGGPPKVDWR